VVIPGPLVVHEATPVLLHDTVAALGYCTAVFAELLERLLTVEGWMVIEAVFGVAAVESSLVQLSVTVVSEESVGVAEVPPVAQAVWLLQLAVPPIVMPGAVKLHDKALVADQVYCTLCPA